MCVYVMYLIVCMCNTCVACMQYVYASMYVSMCINVCTCAVHYYQCVFITTGSKKSLSDEVYVPILVANM